MRILPSLLLALILAPLAAFEAPPPFAPQAWEVPADAAEAAKAAETWRKKIVAGKVHAEMLKDLTAERVAELEKAAEGGDGLAADLLFHAHFRGTANGRFDHVAARKWLAKGVELGSPASILYYGRCLNGLELGDTISPSAEQKALGEKYLAWAESVYAPLAKKRDGMALCFLGGIEATRKTDQAKTVAWFEQAIKARCPFARADLAEVLRHSKKPEEQRRAVALLEEGAKEGTLICVAELGNCYLHGRVVERDHAKAMVQFTRLAETNSPDALYGTGLCTLWGQGAPRDPVKGNQLILKSAEQGFCIAGFTAAVNCNRARGTPFNPKKMMAILKPFALRGETHSLSLFTEMLITSGHCRKMPEDREEWIRRCIAAGDHDGYHHLIDYQMRQDDWDGVVKTALEVIASEEGENCPKAFMVLGIAAGDGLGGMKRDFGAAMQYLRFAARRGGCEPRLFLGMALRYGWFGETDLEKARKAFRCCLGCACAPGIQAQHQWALMAREGLGGPKETEKVAMIAKKMGGYGIGDACALYGDMLKKGQAKPDNPDGKGATPEYWFKRGIRHQSGWAAFLYAKLLAENPETKPDTLAKHYLTAVNKRYTQPEAWEALREVAPKVANERLKKKVDEALAKHDKKEAAKPPAQTGDTEESRKAKERVEKAKKRDETDPHENIEGKGVVEF